MNAANRDGHSADAYGKWVAPEWTKVERLDCHAGVKAEVPQARRFAYFERVPVNRRDHCARAQLEVVEGCRCCHCE